MMATRWDNKNISFEVEPKKLGKGCPGGPKIAGFTRAQIDAMQFWRDFGDRHGFPPTMRDASNHFLVRPQAVADRCAACVAKGGLVRSKKDLARGLVLSDLGRSLTTSKTEVDPERPLYIQTAHGFVGSVTQERKCACGQSHFTDNVRCADCLRAFSVVT